MGQGEFMRRTGAMGALMDEYDRAVHDFFYVIKSLKQINYQKAISTGKFNSFQSVATHVISAGYHYSNAIRDVFGIDKKNHSPDLEYATDVIVELDKMFKYMLASVADLMEMPESEFSEHNIPVSWNQEYDLEQLIEHAIVHIFRHRRQLEHFWKLIR
jgi:uncharacterized damage-inducible protein DinB